MRRSLPWNRDVRPYSVTNANNNCTICSMSNRDVVSHGVCVYRVAYVSSASVS